MGGGGVQFKDMQSKLWNNSVLFKILVVHPLSEFLIRQFEFRRGIRGENCSENLFSSDTLLPNIISKQMTLQIMPDIDFFVISIVITSLRKIQQKQFLVRFLAYVRIRQKYFQLKLCNVLCNNKLKCIKSTYCTIWKRNWHRNKFSIKCTI